MFKKSKISAGTIRWGSWGSKMSTEKMASIIDQCLANDINTFDTSDVYGNYTTEIELGEAFASLGVARDQYHISTKCGIIKPCAAQPNFRISHYNTSKAHILASIDNSLQHFKTDYIDMYMIARPHFAMNYEEIAEAFDIVKKAGKVLGVGVVSFGASQIRTLSKYCKIDAAQVELSLTNLDPMTSGVVDSCKELEIDLASWSPVGGGAIFTNTRAGQKLEERLHAVADRNEWTLTEMALLFLGYMPAGIVPIINQNKIEKYIEAATCMERSITNEQWFEILNAATGQEFS
jgi:predicted oxidoreductase